MTRDYKLIETEIAGRKVVLYSSPQGDKELFADGVHGLSVSPHLVKFNFYTVSPLHGGEEEYREVVARVVMTLPTFVAVTRFFVERVEELSKAGLIMSEKHEEQKEAEGPEPS
jgi:hypothetical protein